MIRIAWRNLWRHPRRTLLTLAAIALACIVAIFLLALQVGTYTTMKNNLLQVFDGFAQIQQPRYLNDPSLQATIRHPQRLARSAAQISGVHAAAIRASSYALLSKGQHSVGAYLVGVQPGIESRISRIPSTLTKGRYLSVGDAAEVVLGQSLARTLGVEVGNHVTLLGMSRNGSLAADALTVTGIFKSGIKKLDRQLAEMPLGRFQGDFAMSGQANVIVLSGNTLAQVNRALPAVRALVKPDGLAVRDWGELEPGLKHAIQLDASTAMLWYVSLVVVVAAILLNTFLMAVLERTREFGLLLALGMRPAAVGRMIWLETLLLLGISVAVGLAVGAALVAWYGVHGLALPGAENAFAQWGLPGRMYPQLNAFSLLTGPAAIAFCCAVAGVIPYLRARRLEPVPAMRAV